MTEDHVDRLLGRIDAAGIDLNLEVEGIVDRISGINKRVKTALKETLAEYGLTPEFWGVLSALRLHKSRRSSPGALAVHLELSSGAMTSRLDQLEKLGHVRRLPDPEDRRGVVVELTDEGLAAGDAAAGVQGRKEAFFASALTKEEQAQLNGLLRKLLSALEEREAARKVEAAARP